MTLDEIRDIENRIRGIELYNTMIEDLVNNPSAFIERRKAEINAAIGVLNNRPPLTKTVISDGGKSQLITVDRKSLVPAGSIGMAERLQKTIEMLETDPQSFVDQEISRLELKKNRLEALVPEYIEETEVIER